MKGGVRAGKLSGISRADHRLSAQLTNPRKRHPNYRLVKLHRNYSVDEIARLFSIHKNTARMWIRGGLQTIDGKRPILILGQELIRFLRNRRATKKQPCLAGEMFCLRCRQPKVPAAGMIEYHPRTETTGNLTGLCPDCHTVMHRMIAKAQVQAFREKMDVLFPQALPRLREIIQPSLNSDLRGEA